ncbi:hypothetical protein [Synechococcus phage DSL-LC02]|nr:hypothetical protein [Synechococcus phage DSL-LC02]
MKNTHLEHLEDDILNNGTQGGKDAIAFLKSLGKMLSEGDSGMRITTKWDGAPAIICGIDPENGKFFVGTKSVFNKTTPKVCYSESDVDTLYPVGGLNEKLKTSYRYLSQLGIRGVVQGDLLFTNDRYSGSINNKQVYYFTPNTITYAVPQKSEIGERVREAKMGIVFHTTYTGSSLGSMVASFGASVPGNKNVFVASAEFSNASGAANFTPQEKITFNLLLNRAEGSLKQASMFLNVLNTRDKFSMNGIFKQFFNSYIRSGAKFGSVNDTIANFVTYFSQLVDKEIASKKTKASQDKYKKIKDDGLKFIKVNKNSIYFTIASYFNLIKAKDFIIGKLSSVNTFGTFLKTEDGYRVTAPEGFVAIKSGRALKLVDRLEFSRANFTASKNWDKG